MKKCLLLFLLFTSTCSMAQVQEGDTMQFWSVSYIDWPPLWGMPQRIVNAICKKAGQHCYVFVEDVATQPTQAELDTLVSQFDNNFYPNLTPLYGPVPDTLDNDSNVFILALNESNWAGYYDPGQQMTDTFINAHWGMHSSEHEMIFMAADYFSGATEIVAHEFGHLLHWGQDHSPEPPVNPVKYWEDAWIDEGFSTFAAEYLTQDINQQGVMHYNAFFSNDPDIPLVYFLTGASYDQVLLWSVYMYEHFGGAQYIKMLIKEQANGIHGMRKALDSLGYSGTFEDVFEQWIIANYIDDPVFDGGKYSYYHFNFPTAQQTYTHSTYPTGLKTQTLTAFGADYNVFNTTSAGQLDVTFDSDSSMSYRLDFILKNGTTTVDVISVQPDAQGQAVFNAADFGTDYNKIIMAVMCVDTTLSDSTTAPYSYSATFTPSSVNDYNDGKDLLIYPDPAGNVLYIRIDDPNSACKGEYIIMDNKGSFLMTNSFHGKNVMINTSELKAGVYFIKIEKEGNVRFSKFVKE